MTRQASTGPWPLDDRCRVGGTPFRRRSLPWCHVLQAATRAMRRTSGAATRAAGRGGTVECTARPAVRSVGAVSPCPQRTGRSTRPAARAAEPAGWGSKVVWSSSTWEVPAAGSAKRRPAAACPGPRSSPSAIASESGTGTLAARPGLYSGAGPARRVSGCAHPVREADRSTARLVACGSGGFGLTIAP